MSCSWFFRSIAMCSQPSTSRLASLLDLYTLQWILTDAIQVTVVPISLYYEGMFLMYIARQKVVYLLNRCCDWHP